MSEATTAPRPLVRLSGVNKQFGNGVVALANLDLDIGEHQFVSLLGPSGCGKSTALRLIAGLSEPTSGVIEWPRRTGRPMETAGLAGEIGFVFQEPTLMPWATVFDNAWLPLRLQRKSRGDSVPEVGASLEMVGLTGFENAYPRELSGGMKMRVSIARALVTKPKVLLMDEPFAALDEITRFKLNNDLLDLWRSQAWTVVFVTHSVYESVYLSTRIVVMAARPGRVFAEHAVDAPYPRHADFRTSAPYHEHYRRVSQTLVNAMAG